MPLRSHPETVAHVAQVIEGALHDGGIIAVAVVLVMVVNGVADRNGGGPVALGRAIHGSRGRRHGHRGGWSACMVVVVMVVMVAVQTGSANGDLDGGKRGHNTMFGSRVSASASAVVVEAEMA